MTLLPLYPRRIAAVLLVGIATLVSLYVATQYYRIRVAAPRLQAAMRQPDWPTDAAAAHAKTEQIINPRRIVSFCDLDAEASLPTAWSMLQLFLAAGILALIARQRKAIGDQWWVLWTVLSVGFVVLALDEGGSLHGSLYLASTSEEARRERGIFYFSWIIPAMIGTAVVGLAYLQFLWMLPHCTRWLILLAGVGYVGSALGGEMAQGWWLAHSMGRDRMGWVAITIVEEAGEMLSIVLFIHTLLCHMRDQRIAVLLTVPADAQASTDVSESVGKPASMLAPSPAGSLRHTSG